MEINQEFVNMIVRSAEQIAKEKNMEDKDKAEYINKRLFEHFERNGIDEIDKKIIYIYKKAYPNFSEDEFTKYAINNTKNTNVIFNEKLKLEDKIEQINKEIKHYKKELGIFPKYQQQQEKEENQDKYLYKKIENIKEKYSMKAEETEKLSDEQIEENIKLIEEMINSCESEESLYKTAKEQIAYFNGMGESYNKTLREKSPELNKYIEEKLEEELAPLQKKEEKYKKDIQYLTELKKGFEECIKKVYDPKLEKERRGDKVDRRIGGYVETKTETRKEKYGY